MAVSCSPVFFVGGSMALQRAEEPASSTLGDMRCFAKSVQLHSGNIIPPYIAQGEYEGQTVAVKVIEGSSNDAREWERLQAEVWVGSALDHPNLVRTLASAIVARPAQQPASISDGVWPPQTSSGSCDEGLTGDLAGGFSNVSLQWPVISGASEGEGEEPGRWAILEMEADFSWEDTERVTVPAPCSGGDGGGSSSVGPQHLTLWLVQTYCDRGSLQVGGARCQKARSLWAS